MKRTRNISAVKIGLVVIGAIAIVALLKIGGGAVSVATAAIGVIGGWLARDAVGDVHPPPDMAPVPASIASPATPTPEPPPKAKFIPQP